MAQHTAAQVQPKHRYDRSLALDVCGRAQGAFLEETFKSVVGQSYQHWEMIIVDDGSPDDTWDKVSQLRTPALCMRCGL